MPKAIDLKPDGRFFGMFISRSGGGKSSAAMTFRKPIEDMDADMRMRGTLWMRDLKPEWWGLDDPGYKGINYTTYTPDKGFADIEKALEIYGMQFKAGQRPFETLVMDSATSHLRLLITDALHAEGAKVKKTLTLKRPGPNEYGYEAEAFYQILDYIRGFPCNVIVTAHIIEKYGKKDPDDDYSESVVVGEKLSIRDKIGENMLIYFDEVYRFETSASGKKKTVRFRSDMAKTAYPTLPDELDITGKNFFVEWSRLVNQEPKGK